MDVSYEYATCNTSMAHRIKNAIESLKSYPTDLDSVPKQAKTERGIRLAIPVAIEAMERFPVWIPVSERMPEEHDSIFINKFYGTSKWSSGMWKKNSEDVLVLIRLKDGNEVVKEGRTHDGKFVNDTLRFIDGSEATHWMPMPGAELK